MCVPLGLSMSVIVLETQNGNDILFPHPTCIAHCPCALLVSQMVVVVALYAIPHYYYVLQTWAAGGGMPGDVNIT